MFDPEKEISFENMGVIKKEGLVAYANASGDYNPIHQDEKAAKEAGLPGIIAHGMLIAGFISRRLHEWMEENGLLDTWFAHETQMRFKAMTFLNDTISVGGKVRESDSESISLQLQAQDQKGELKCLASLVLKKIK